MNFNYSLELFRNSSTGQFLLNHHGVIIKSNPAFSKMIGFSEKEIENKPLNTFLDSKSNDIYIDIIKPFFSNRKRSVTANLKYINQEKESGWWKITMDKTIIGSVYIILAVVVDIKSEIESQGDLLEAKTAAEKSEASKSIFLANMSHEIRTPIHTVTGLAELLQDTNLDSEQGEYVSQIEFAAKVLLTLINDILDFSKIEAGKLVFENIEYNLYETIINSVDLSALEAHKKGVDVAISLDKKMPHYILGDQVRLRQIIVNLMSNAVKFTKVGEIILHVEFINNDNGLKKLKFSVTDSGIGISKEKQSNLFKAFSQADTSTTREFGGTGLGLSISSSLVQMMGGQMKVESEEGKGACFYFEIPITPGMEYKQIDKKPIDRNLNILVVDDNQKVNKIFSDILRNWDYSVTEVYTVMDAINELVSKASGGTPYDICFIDQLLPGMDGWQLAGEIHSNGLIKYTKKVLMSLKGKGIEESKMKLLGWFQGYVTKPVNKESLYKIIKDIFTLEESEDLQEFEDLDDLEELDSIDDDFMEPLSFSDSAFEVIEDLEPVDEDEYLHELTNFKSMDFSTVEDEKDVLEFEKGTSVVTKKILVVEDHLVNQKLFRTILMKLGYDVIVASDGKEAVEVVDTEKVDLIFMDCQMPIMNGYDATLKIREHGFTLPIIAVTASAVKGEYEKCINCGMSDVMTKPFKKDDVGKFLDKWLNKMEGYMLFDYNKALERFMGEREILIDVLPSYIENLELNIKELETLNPLNDCKRIREIAHSIKGSSLNLDIVAIGKEAEALEDLAFNESLSGIPERVKNVVELAAQTIDELRNYK
ncbi:MAG: response regulator [Spirochaetales bacterium]|nr:response regulator [Spirochaetales bacterium]